MRAKEFLLLEYNQEKTAQVYGAGLVDTGTKDPYIRQARDAWTRQFLEAARSQETQELAATILLIQIENIDPTPHKEYSQWLAKIFANKTTKFEDLLSRGKDALAKFQKLKIKKQLAPEHRDINRFKDLGSLESTMASYPDVDGMSAEKGKAKEYYKDADLRIIVPEDETAAKYYGQGTKWCTAAKNNNMFNHYNRQGPLYIIIPTKTNHAGEKYQFHFESGQFMDDSDTPIDMTAMVNAYPQLKAIFSGQAKSNLVIELLDNAKEVITRFNSIKRQATMKAAGLVRTNINRPTLLALKKDYIQAGVSASQAAELVDNFYEALLDDGDGLADSILHALNIKMISNEDELWDGVYFIGEEWLSDLGLSDIGFASEVPEDSQFDVVTATAQVIFDKLTKPLVASVKEKIIGLL